MREALARDRRARRPRPPRRAADAPAPATPQARARAARDRPRRRVSSRAAISTRFSSTGREGRRGEALAGLEHAAEQGRQRDEQQIGEGDPAELDRERELQRARREAGGQDAHQPGHQRARPATTTAASVSASTLRASPANRSGRGTAAARAQPGEQRHERGAEGALGEQAAQEVGELQADEERIGHRAGAQRRGDQQVAHEAGDARQRREPAHGQRGTADAHARGQHLGQLLLHPLHLAAVGDLQAEHVLDVEHVDHALAVGADVGAVDHQAQILQRLGELEQQARAVAAVDLDDAVGAAGGVVDQHPRLDLEHVGPLGQAAAAGERLLEPDLAAQRLFDIVADATQPGLVGRRPDG